MTFFRGPDIYIKFRLWARIARLAAVVLLTNHCAYMEPPPGGPEDKTPPYLKALKPAPGALNQPLNMDIEFHFSEWVQKDIQRNKIIISPLLPIRPSIKVSGDIVKIECDKPLSINTTYIVSLLPTIQDLHQTQLVQPFTLMFSTGPSLDTGHVTTRAWEKDNLTPSYLLGLYPLEGRSRWSHITDTTHALPHPATERPLYLAPSDTLGNADLNGIIQGPYRLLAFQDINGNFKPDIGTEKIAIGPELHCHRDTKPLGLFLGDYDTLKLKLLSANFQGDTVISKGQKSQVRGVVSLKFSSDIILPESNPQNLFKVISADSVDTIPIISFAALPANREIELALGALNIDSTYLVYSLGGRDKYQNSMDTVRFWAPFKAQRNIDSLPGRYMSINYKSGDSGVFLRHRLKFSSSKTLIPLSVKTLQKQITCTLDDSILPINVEVLNHRYFVAHLPSLPYKGQRLAIKQNIPAAVDTSARQDSTDIKTDSLKPEAVNKDSYRMLLSLKLARGSALTRCEIVQPDKVNQWTVTMTHITSKHEFEKKCLRRGQDVIDSLPPGAYTLKYYLDKNNNGRWDAGRIKPWVPQEAFGTFSDTLTLDSSKTGRAVLSWPVVTSKNPIHTTTSDKIN